MKYTILIPCYNAEKYISRCLNSIVNQDYQDFEIIVLNDGSTDNSLAILNSYQEKDQRIKIISRENKGLSVTRNDLIKKVHTDYFYFIDADDWIELNTFSTFDMKLKEVNFVVDMIINSTFINKKNKSKTFYITNKIDENTTNESYLINNTPYAWNILIRKEYLLENKFSFCQEYNYFEDAGSVSFWIYKTKNIIFLNHPNYHYFINKQSLSRANISFEKISAGISQLENFYSLLKSDNVLIKDNKPINDQLAFYHSVIFSHIQFETKVNKSEKNILKTRLRSLEKDNVNLKFPRRYWKFWYFVLYRIYGY